MSLSQDADDHYDSFVLDSTLEAVVEGKARILKVRKGGTCQLQGFPFFFFRRGSEFLMGSYSSTSLCQKQMDFIHMIWLINQLPQRLASHESMAKHYVHSDKRNILWKTQSDTLFVLKSYLK